MDDQGVRDYFNFDDADLIANRNGKLSEKQRKKLVKADKDAKKYSLPGALFFFAIASIFPIVFIPMAISAWQEQDYGGAGVSLIGPLVWVLVWGGVGYVFLRSFFDDKHSISKITIKKVEGPVHFESRKAKPGENVQYNLEIGKVKLDVVEDHLRSAMPEGDAYAIYCYKFKDVTGNHVLSAEWLTKGAVESAPQKPPDEKAAGQGQIA
jgi:hypothetical protein